MNGQQGPQGGALIRVTGTLATTGPAQSTERISFGGEVITWDQLPAQTRRLARRRAALIAEVVELDGHALAKDGRALESATAWRAHEDAVVVVTVVRPVAPAAAGGTRPVGPWEHRTVRVLEASGPVRRRRGVVDVADELAPGTRTGRAGTPARHAQAAEAWSYLPHVVRAAAERLVPEPLLWMAQLVQEQTADGFPVRQDVRSLRLSAERAVVVVATRSLASIPSAGVNVHVAQMARVPWVVEQVGFDLGEASAGRTLLDRV